MVVRICQSFPLLTTCIDDWPLIHLFRFKIEDMRRNTGRVTGGNTALVQQVNVVARPTLPNNVGVNSPTATTTALSNRADSPGIVPTAQMVTVEESSYTDNASEAPEHQSGDENTFSEPHSAVTIDSELPVQSEAHSEAPPESSQRKLRNPRSTNNVPIARRQPSKAAQKRLANAKTQADIATKKIAATVAESSKNSSGRVLSKKMKQLVDEAREKEERMAKGKQKAVTRNDKNAVAEIAAKRLRSEAENGLKNSEDEEFFTDFDAPFQSVQGGQLVETFFTYKRQKRSD